MKDFFKSFLAFGLASTIEKLLGFVLLPLYTHIFSIEEYGSMDLVQTIIGVATVFGVLQIETSFQRYYYEYKKIKKRLFLSNIYFITIGLSLTTSIILYFLSPLIVNQFFNNEDYILIIKVACLQIPLINYNMLGLIQLRYEKKNKKFLGVILLKVISTFLTVGLFVIMLKKGVLGVFLAQLITLILSSVLITFYVHQNMLMKISTPMIQKSINYAFPQIPARFGSVTLSYANRFFMVSFLSLSLIGLYSVALKWASSIQLLYTSFVMAWSPFMFSQFKNNDKHKVIFAKILPLVSFGLFPIICFVAIFSEEIFKLTTSADFFLGHKYLGGLALFFGLYIIKEIVDVGPKFLEKTKFLSLNFLLSVVVNVGLLYILTPILGLEGVVISMLCTNLFLVGISWYTSNRLYYIDFSVLWFIVSLIPALILCLFPMYFIVGIGHRIVIAVVCVLFYGIVFYLKYKEFVKIKI